MDYKETIKELEEKVNALQREVNDLYQADLNIVNLVYELRQKIDLIESHNQYETLQTGPVMDSPKTVPFTEQDFF